MVSYYFGLMLLPFFSVNLKWLILECFQYKFPCQHTKSSLFQRLWKNCIPWSNIWNIFHTLGNHWYFECVYRNLWFSVFKRLFYLFGHLIPFHARAQSTKFIILTKYHKSYHICPQFRFTGLAFLMSGPNQI